MRNYIILNGQNSNEITGLLIQTLPPISQPKIRTNIEEIDGRDGDIITKLGYSAYNKEISIGLYGNYNVDDIIKYFTDNQSGKVTFSDEPDKYYYYEILDQVDFDKLIRYRTATVTLHCQPFKYSTTEEKIQIDATEVSGSGSNITLNNTEDGALFTSLQINGDTLQDGTPTPSAPINVDVVTGDNTIDVCGKNLANDENIKLDYTLGTSGELISNNTRTTFFQNEIKPSTTYNSSVSTNYLIGNLFFYDSNKNYLSQQTSSWETTKTFTTPNNAYYISFATKRSDDGTMTQSDLNTLHIQLEKGSLSSTYEPYIGNSYEVNLGKNLFDKSTITNGYRLDGSGAPSGVANNEFTSDFISVKPNTTYIRNIGNISAYTRTCFYDGSKTFISKDDSNQTFTTPSNAYYLRFSEYTSRLDTMQLEKGTQASSYSPYFTPIELCKIGDYQDYIYKENGNWYKYNAIGKVVLDGTETGWLSQTQTGFYRYGLTINDMNNDSSLADVVLIISNFFKGITFNGRGSSGYETIYAVSNNQQHQFFVNTQQYSTIAEFKTWLNTNNLIVYYVLAIPTTTQITDTNLITQLEALAGATTYLGQTNIITSGSELNPLLEVTTFAVDDPSFIITNSGNINSKPIITIYGLGTIGLYLNGIQVLSLDMGETTSQITIDVAKMEAYNQETGALMNRSVTGDYNNLSLNVGENTITESGTLQGLEVENYSRWL